MKLVAFLSAGLVALAACPTTITTSSSSSPPDAGDVGPQVCGHLAEIGCPQPKTCLQAFHLQAEHLVDLRPSCLLAASSPAAAEACGSLRCSSATTTDAGP